MRIPPPAHGCQLHARRKFIRILIAVHLWIEFFNPLHTLPNMHAKVFIVIGLALEHHQLAWRKINQIKAFRHLSRIIGRDFNTMRINAVIKISVSSLT